MKAIRLHLNDDACADLVLDLMDDATRAVAEAHLRECRECEERLRAHAGAAVRARADLAGGVGIAVVQPALPARRIPWLAALSTAAAVAAVAFAVRGPLKTRNAGSHWLARPDDLVRVRGEQPIDDALRAGFEAYARHDAPAAVAALERAHASGGTEQARRLYLGSALLAVGRPSDARRCLESVQLEILPQPWHDEGVAALAAAMRATGDAGRADSIERMHAR